MNDQSKHLHGVLQRALNHAAQMMAQILDLQEQLATITAERDALRAAMRPPTNGATQHAEAG